MEIFYDFFFIIGVLLCAVYIFVIYKNNKTLELHHKILISILTVFAFIFLHSYSNTNKASILSSFTFLIAISAKIIIPVLLFFYIKSIFIEERNILKKHKYLLTFPIFFIGIYIVPSIITNILFHLFHLTGHYEYLPKLAAALAIFWRTLRPLRSISNLIALTYLIICLRYFFSLKKSMKSNYSYINNNNYIWIRFLLIFPLLLICLDLIFIGLGNYTSLLKAWRNTEIITSCSLVISILIMAYFGLKQTKILVPYFLLDDNQEQGLKTINKNNHFKTEFNSLEKKLRHVFEIQKPYLNTDLTLGELAKTVETTDKKMSALLNQHLQISFYEFVNNYRIEAFKEALQNNEYKDYTIEAISYECGFKSKASFYRIFKSKMNISPSAYKNSLT